MQSEQIDQLATALAKAQGEMENAVMDKINPHFESHYASLSAVIEAIRKPLSANGLAVTQTMHLTTDNFVLRTTLMHTSGQWKDSDYPLPNTPKPHEMGSALTYARRYSLSAIISNASEEDDDGNAAMAGNAADSKEYKLKQQPKTAAADGTQLKGILKSYSDNGKFFGGWINDTYVWTGSRVLGEDLKKLADKLADLTVAPDGKTKNGRPKARVMAVFAGVATDPDQPPTANIKDLEEYDPDGDDIDL